MADADLLVVGGGPAGVAAALRARELGASVVLFEPERLGGMCLHRGCVPTVTAVEIANRQRLGAESTPWGLNLSVGKPDLDLVRRRLDDVVDRIHAGTRSYLEQAGIVRVEGPGQVLPGCAVEVAGRPGRPDRFTGRGVVLATGAAFILPDLPGMDLPGVWTTDHCLALAEVPAELVVYGGGFIGVEWAQFYRAFGSRVVIVEPGPQLLPDEDPEVAEALKFLLEQEGIEVRTGRSLTRLEARDGRLAVVDRDSTLMADRLLVSDCRRPRGAGLESLGGEGPGRRRRH